MIALTVALLAAAASAPDPLAIAFAPPIGAALRYETRETRKQADETRETRKQADETRETRKQADETLRFTLLQRYVFAREDGGYRLDSTTESYGADAPPRVKRAFEAAMAPFVGVTMHTLVSAGGEPRAVLDAETTWRQVNEALAAQRRAMEADPESTPEARDAVRGYLAAFAALPEAERRERLLAPARDLLGFAHPLLAVGRSAPYRIESPTPFGGRIAIAGTLTLVAAGANEAHFRTEAKSDPADVARAAAALRATLTSDMPAAQRDAVEGAARALGTTAIGETADILVSRASGLVTMMRSIRRTTLGSGADAATETAERELRLLP